MKNNNNEKIVERYRLQSMAAKICYVEGKKEGLQYPQNWHKVSKCRNTRRSDTVDVFKSKEHGTAHYGGLVVCARSWVCPVCAPLMQAKRADRVIHVFRWAYNSENRLDAIQQSEQEYQRRKFEDQDFNAGELSKKKRRGFMPSPELLKSDLKVVMLTLTTPHNKNQSTEDLFRDFIFASQHLRAGKKWTTFRQRVGYVAEVIGTEITYGINGPHLHRHMLWVIKNDKNNDDTKSQFYDFFINHWGQALQKTGLLTNDVNSSQYKGFLTHGVDIIPYAQESDYLTKAGSDGEKQKWGADAEVTKQSKKAGEMGNRTAFQILHDSEKSSKDAELFLSYVKGTKGKSQLQFSRGFKTLLGLEELEEGEQDLLDALEGNNSADLLAMLTPADWALVVQSKNRGKLLVIAQMEGAEGIKKFLKELENPVAKQEVLGIDDLFKIHFNTLAQEFDNKKLGFEIDPRKALNDSKWLDFCLDFYHYDLVKMSEVA